MSTVVRIFVKDAKALFTPVNNEVFFILIILECVAKKTVVFFLRFLNIGDAPGRPKVLHCLIT